MLTAPTQAVTLVAAAEVGRMPLMHCKGMPAPLRCVRDTGPPPARRGAASTLSHICSLSASPPDYVTPFLAKYNKTLQRVVDGRRYYDFEFTAQSKSYTRHALASITVRCSGGMDW